MRINTLAVLPLSLLVLAGCSRLSPDTAQAAGKPAYTASDPAVPVPVPYTKAGGYTKADGPPVDERAPQLSAETIAAGTSFRVRLLETLDTRHNRSGDRFTASLDEPLVDGDRVIVPKGTTFSGHVVESKPSGRLKGRAVLALRLDGFTLRGESYEIRSTDSARASAGHKKHNLAWIGGGSGGGALIGAAAGGGMGALIGSGAGAAAGTVGSVVTGKRQVRLPVETALRFRLESAVALSN